MKILNRIVTFALALAVFPAAVTRIIIRVVITPGGTLASIMGETGIEESLSVLDIIERIQSGSFEFLEPLFHFENLPRSVSEGKGWLITSAVMLVIALLIAIIIMGCSLFTQAHKTVMSLSAGGALACFLAMTFFGNFASPFVEGQVDIGEILAESAFENAEGIGGFISYFLSGTVEINVFQLGNAVVTMALLFIGILLWTVAYYVTLPAGAKLAIKNPPVKEKKVKEKKVKNNK